MDIKQLQRDLNALGYACGPADGVVGRRTSQAILDFRIDWKVGEGYPAVAAAIGGVYDGSRPMPDASAITPERLRAFLPDSDYKLWAPILNAECRQALITTPRRVRHFLSQLAHETGEFRVFTENLNYRDPVRLNKMFSAVKGVEDARALIARGPSAIANRVYANRGGNGNEASGDGWRYRGRGLIQMTLKDNYVKATRWTGVDLVRNPDRILEPVISVRAACGYWVANRINEMVDRDSDEQYHAHFADHIRYNEEDDLREASRAVNGPAMAGLDDRRRLLNIAAKIWVDQ